MDGEELETANWGRSSAGDALRFRSASGVGCEFAWPIIMRGDTKLCAPFNDSLNPADQACAGGENMPNVSFEDAGSCHHEPLERPAQ
ncbi:MAG TPA: hypothetical protein VF182_03650 [Candidatus Binatia bacterium]